MRAVVFVVTVAVTCAAGWTLVAKPWPIRPVFVATAG